jgi:hypothetical protein
MQTVAATIPTSAHEACANCGLTLSGKFCAGCGQSVEAIRRPAWEFVHHALETFFDFDARGVKTLALLFVPGEVTAQYLAGRRARFVPPIRFYVLVSLAFFLAIWATNTAMVQFYAVKVPAGQTASRLGLKLLEPLDEHPSSEARAVVERLHIFEIDGKAPDWANRISDGLQRATSDPKLLNERLSDLFPKLMFSLVPLFGLLLRLLYLLRGRLLVEHLVFALYFHSFAFILASLLIVIAPILPVGVPKWLFFLITAGYLLVAMRRVFGGGWFGTAIREAVLLSLYGLILTAGELLLIGAGLSEV